MASKYFYRWRELVDASRERRKEWQEIHNEEIEENEFASEYLTDPVYWCWNCKHSDCERHQGLMWERETLSDSDSE
jgi:hypothetical protein